MAARKRHLETLPETEFSETELLALTVVGYAVKLFPGASPAASAISRGQHLVPVGGGPLPLQVDRYDVRAALGIEDLLAVAAASYSHDAEAAFFDDRFGDLDASGPSGERDETAPVPRGGACFAPPRVFASADPDAPLNDEPGGASEYPFERLGRGRGARHRVDLSGVSVASDANAVPVAHRDQTIASLKDSEGRQTQASCDALQSGAENPVAIAATDAAAVVPPRRVWRPQYSVLPFPASVRAWPATASEHAVIEATARRVAEQPQLEVLLRVKQAGNPVWAFLDADDPLHAYYAHLRLRASAERGRVQGELAEVGSTGSLHPAVDWPAAVEVSEEVAAVAASTASVSDAAPAGTPAIPGALQQAAPPATRRSLVPAYNPLGIAYGSSDDDGDDFSDDGVPASSAHSSTALPSVVPALDPSAAAAAAAARRAAAALSARAAAQDAASRVLPPPAVAATIDKLLAHVRRGAGQRLVDQVAAKERANPTFAFLLPWNTHHAFFARRLKEVLVEMGPPEAEPEPREPVPPRPLTAPRHAEPDSRAKPVEAANASATHLHCAAASASAGPQAVAPAALAPEPPQAAPPSGTPFTPLVVSGCAPAAAVGVVQPAAQSAAGLIIDPFACVRSAGSHVVPPVKLALPASAHHTGSAAKAAAFESSATLSAADLLSRAITAAATPALPASDAGSATASGTASLHVPSVVVAPSVRSVTLPHPYAPRVGALVAAAALNGPPAALIDVDSVAEAAVAELLGRSVSGVATANHAPEEARGAVGGRKRRRFDAPTDAPATQVGAGAAADASTDASAKGPVASIVADACVSEHSAPSEVLGGSDTRAPVVDTSATCAQPAAASGAIRPEECTDAAGAADCRSTAPIGAREPPAGAAGESAADASVGGLRAAVPIGGGVRGREYITSFDVIVPPPPLSRLAGKSTGAAQRFAAAATALVTPCGGSGYDSDDAIDSDAGLQAWDSAAEAHAFYAQQEGRDAAH